MVTSLQAFHKYGIPDGSSHMVLWDVPAEFEVAGAPKKVFCNTDLVDPLCAAFCNLSTRNLQHELRTWDGCLNIRAVRGYEKKYQELLGVDPEAAMKYLSLHSWALAIDVNAAWNGLGAVPTLSPGFVACFTDAGFDWGGNFKRKDGMHFQLAKLPA